MITIWKYKLETTDIQTIEMPLDAEILTVQEQNGDINMWVKVDTEKTLVKREIFIYGTGNPIFDNDNSKYIGTFQLKSGMLVFHVFDNGYVKK